jgi:hypothetical protein
MAQNGQELLSARLSCLASLIPRGIWQWHDFTAAYPSVRAQFPARGTLP